MTKDKILPVTANRSLGDVAVDGLWPGLAGGMLMIAYLVVVGIFSGVRPSETFGYFLPDAALPALAGLGSHLAVSAVYGSIFGLIKAGIRATIGRRRPSWPPMWLAGILYAFLLWLLAALIIIPSDVSGLGQIPAGHLLTAHLVYGLVIGRLLVNARP